MDSPACVLLGFCMDPAMPLHDQWCLHDPSKVLRPPIKHSVHAHNRPCGHWGLVFRKSSLEHLYLKYNYCTICVYSNTALVLKVYFSNWQHVHFRNFSAVAAGSWRVMMSLANTAFVVISCMNSSRTLIWLLSSSYTVAQQLPHTWLMRETCSYIY